MTEAHVNQATRQDTVGVMLRQKQTLDLVSAVLCDGLGDAARWWRVYALDVEARLPVCAERMRAIADLIEETNL